MRGEILKEFIECFAIVKVLFNFVHLIFVSSNKDNFSISIAATTSKQYFKQEWQDS